MVYVLTVRVMVDAGRVEGSDNIVDPLHDNINKILEERRERLSHLLRYPPGMLGVRDGVITHVVS